MSDKTGTLASWKVAGETRLLDLSGTDVDPLVAGLMLRDAADRLAEGLKNLIVSRRRWSNRIVSRTAWRRQPKPNGFSRWINEEPAGMSIRPRFDEEPDAPARIQSLLAAAAAAPPLSQFPGPLKLDPITAVDDANFLR
ncbi:hypothetical protein LMG27177_06060 [Paraburkholderia fynbosensis]|uniref:Uncharacterized protein n=2 Tax=Paraburkholderia fynbosensis TaxID=1200993 RepID=A0A6J5GU57_9BURK|nr:hypothetical protein LMG27177_06060 [Paraburkholderia fynbosensis]